MLEECHGLESPPCPGLGSATYGGDPASEFERGGLSATSLSVGVACRNWRLTEPSQCTNGPTIDALMSVWAARVTLADEVVPALASAPELIASSAHEVIVTARATDLGSGVTGAAVLVDDTVSARSDPNLPETCRAPYTAVVPCPQMLDLAIPISLARVPNGSHSLRIALTDAAGNQSLSEPLDVATRDGSLTEVKGPEIVPVSSPDGSNGTAATRFARLRSWFEGRSRRSLRTIGYGERTRVAGLLESSAGVPIGGAVLSVEERVVGLASAAKPVSSVKTDARGRFSYPVAAGPSRTVRFSYRAFPGDPGPVAVGQVTVHVRAGVSLRVSPGIPAPSVYRFEARVPRQTGFPYSEGASPSVVVHGRP